MWHGCRIASVTDTAADIFAVRMHRMFVLRNLYSVDLSSIKVPIGKKCSPLTCRDLQFESSRMAIFMRAVLCENGLFLHIYAEKYDFYLQTGCVNNNFY